MVRQGMHAVPGDDREGRPAPQRGRKKRRRWCKGKRGVQHAPEIVLSHHATWRQQYYGTKVVCQWREQHHWETTVEGRVWTGTGEWTWMCFHEDECANCGKILSLGWGVGERCPHYAPRPPEQ